MKELTGEERFKILRSKRIDPTVIEYLTSKLNNLYIEVLGEYEGLLFELMSYEKLEGWCWQTTESAIVFLNDDDYIERGDLKLNEGEQKYYHSWICFKFAGVEYVLDPCLNLLCKRRDYWKIFEVNVKGIVSAKTVREELIRQLTTPKKEDDLETHQAIRSLLKRMLGDSYENEVIVHGPEDVSTPLYRNGAGYKNVEIDRDKVKKLTVHYYYTDG